MSRTFLWAPGKHVITRNPTVTGIEDMIGTVGWNLRFVTWSEHDEGQARKDFTFDRAVQDITDNLLELRHQHPKEPVVLCGIGFGAWPAAYVATQGHHQIQGLALLNPTMQYVGRTIRLLARGDAEKEKAFLHRFSFEEPFSYEVKKADGNKVRHKVPMRFVRECGMDGYNVVDNAHKVTCPLLVSMAPDEGFLSTPEVTEAFFAGAGSAWKMRIQNDRSFAHTRGVIEDSTRGGLLAFLRWCESRP